MSKMIWSLWTELLTVPEFVAVVDPLAGMLRLAVVQRERQGAGVLHSLTRQGAIAFDAWQLVRPVEVEPFRGAPFPTP